MVCGGVKGEIGTASFTHSPSGPPYERHDFHSTRWIKRWSQTVLQVDTGGRVRRIHGLQVLISIFLSYYPKVDRCGTYAESALN